MRLETGAGGSRQWIGRAATACVAAALLASGTSLAEVPRARPEDVGMSSERLARIATVVERHIEAGDVAGVVTLVARRGRVVHLEARGYQDIRSRTPMRTDSIFRLASMSKPITAVAIMMLVEEGEVRLTDPVSRFIPELASLDRVAVPRPGGDEGAYDLVPAEREITVRDLLTHASGLLSGGLGVRVNEALARTAPDDTLASYIPRLGQLALDFQPGTLWRYSGLAGFDVLSRIVEVASGQPYDEFLRTRLFEPLGMSDTGFYFDEARLGRVATLYRRDGNALVPVDRPFSRTYFSGAGGLASTAEDYFRFAQMLLEGGALDGRRILGPRTIEWMVANHTGDKVNGQFGRPPAGMGFGLGMQVVLDPVAADLAVSKGAYSWPGGTGVSFWIEPAEELVSIYMIQGGNGAPLRRAFENAVRQAIID